MSGHNATAPSTWIERFAARVPSGPVLDVAAGAGRHTRFFQELGHPVTAIDRDVSRLLAFAADPTVTVIPRDLEGEPPWPFAGQTFAAVVVTNYLHRPLFPALLLSVAPGGLLLYETFAAGNERFGKPSHPDHLLRPGELLEVVRDTLQVVAYEHLVVDTPYPAVVQRVAAQHGATYSWS